MANKNQNIISVKQGMTRHAPKDIRVLCACEESQAVCIEFRKLGFDAYSCDIQPCSGGHPEWHIQGDVVPVLQEKWDCIIAFPPCTHLCVSGARWFKEGKKPMSLQNDGADFFMMFVNNVCDHIAVENPVGCMSTRYRKPNQIINPFQFGHPEQKKTCLWLKGLPKLLETENVYDHMITLPMQIRTRIHWLGSNKSKERSKTFPGIAKAMAEQWGAHLLCANSPVQDVKETRHTAMLKIFFTS